eukprot:2172929-Karenia_brevis.AAC.1
MHGFKPDHTQGFLESIRISFIGNSFHCIAGIFVGFMGIVMWVLASASDDSLDVDRCGVPI